MRLFAITECFDITERVHISEKKNKYCHVIIYIRNVYAGIKQRWDLFYLQSKRYYKTWK